MNRIIEAFTRPTWQITTVDKFIIGLVCTVVVLIAVGIYIAASVTVETLRERKHACFRIEQEAEKKRKCEEDALRRGEELAKFRIGHPNGGLAGRRDR